MRLITVFLLAITLFVLSGCDPAMKSGRDVATSSKPEATARSGDNTSSALVAPPAPPAAKASMRQRQAEPAHGGGGGGGGGEAEYQMTSLADVTTAQPAAGITDRKVIRNAELAIETDSPADGQRRITSIAEAHGGFVVTSESKHSESAAQSAPSETVTVIVRVPSAQFGAVMEKIQSIGGRLKQEKISGQDVTEEYTDLEARIRTQKALELQFLEIMKQARKISDALEVQNQLAEVRTQIERLEGRRRFLENQSSLSTITITLQTPLPVVTATTNGFLHSFKEAFGDSIDMATAIVLGLIRLIAMLIPVLALIVLPAGLLLRALIRRYGWFKKPQPVPQA